MFGARAPLRLGAIDFTLKKESKKLISLIEDFKFLFKGVRMQHFSYKE